MFKLNISSAIFYHSGERVTTFKCGCWRIKVPGKVAINFCRDHFNEGKEIYNSKEFQTRYNIQRPTNLN